MTIRNILTEPNKLLRQISQKVDKVGKEEQKLMDWCSKKNHCNGPFKRKRKKTNVFYKSRNK